MILDALVNQFARRFQHEKRAWVCLWFDERREFARLRLRGFERVTRRLGARTRRDDRVDGDLSRLLRTLA